jgi:hypothetical protein
LGLFLLPAGQSGRRFTGADDEATAASIEALFLLPRGRPRPRFSIGAPMFRRDPPASAMETGGGKKETLDKLKRKNMMRRKEKLMTGLGFFYPRQACIIYKHALMSLYKGTVQNIITGSYMLPNADDKRKLNVSKKKVRGKVKKGEEVIYKEA